MPTPTTCSRRQRHRARRHRIHRAQRRAPTRHLLRLFGELGVATQPTEMSMSVHCDGLRPRIRRGSGPRRACSPSHVTLRSCVPADADRGAAVPPAGAPRPRGRRRHCHPGRLPGRRPVLDYFVALHGADRLLGLVDVGRRRAVLPGPLPVRLPRQPRDAVGHRLARWRTVIGGSRTYVERVVEASPSVAPRPRSASSSGTPTGSRSRDGDDQVDRFDRVVVATHADTALPLLADPTAEERELLGAFRYSRNETLLHTDTVAAARVRRPGRPGTTGCRSAWRPQRTSWSATT